MLLTLGVKRTKGQTQAVVTPRSPNAALATKNDTPRSPNTALLDDMD